MNRPQTVPFDQVQAAEKAIYDALAPLPNGVRDRVLRHVMEQFGLERNPLEQKLDQNKEV